jgi:hypothetical protein
LLAQTLKAARATLASDPEAFCQRLEAIELLGYLSGYVKGAVRSGRYVRLRRV